MNTSKTMTRRDFHRRVGEGMLWAGLGSALAAELGLSKAFAEQAEGDRKLRFGASEGLVGFMEDTPLDQLQRLVVEKLQKGEVTLEGLLQAAALANARSFGGADYVGMHTLMAMGPAYRMAQLLPADRKALIVLKILHRNTGQIHEKGGGDVLELVEPASLPEGAKGAELLREAVHGQDRARAEGVLAALVKRSAEEAFNDLLHVVEEATDVHRVVFAHRSWEIVDLVGLENAEAMLRQSLRYCLNNETWAAKNQTWPRTGLPKLMEQYKLMDRSPGTRRAEDGWVGKLSETIFASTEGEAAEAVAAALAEGISARDIGEAISLATNQLLLRDAGRTGKQVQPGKPEGSVHGDSIGVHASDSALAWRGIAEVSTPRNAMACLVLAGYQAAMDRTRRGGEFLEWEPRPHQSELAKVGAGGAEVLLRELDGAITESDQGRACALVHRLGAEGADPLAVRDLLVRHATREDGALHGEKYFLTATSDFDATRPAYRWRHLVGLARVTASEAGRVSAGYSEACQLLGVEA